MSLITRSQRQRITYWEPLEANAYGEPRWGAPVEYTARVDAKIMQIIGASDTLVLSRYQLITQVLLEVGGVVVLGEIGSISYWADPKANLNAYEILAVASTPNLRNTETLFECWA